MITIVIIIHTCNLLSHVPDWIKVVIETSHWYTIPISECNQENSYEAWVINQETSYEAWVINQENSYEAWVINQENSYEAWVINQEIEWHFYLWFPSCLDGGIWRPYKKCSNLSFSFEFNSVSKYMNANK